MCTFSATLVVFFLPGLVVPVPPFFGVELVTKRFISTDSRSCLLDWTVFNYFNVTNGLFVLLPFGVTAVASVLTTVVFTDCFRFLPFAAGTFVDARLLDTVTFLSFFFWCDFLRMISVLLRVVLLASCWTRRVRRLTTLSAMSFFCSTFFSGSRQGSSS